MLTKYFAKPETVDRIMSSWIGGAIDDYVGWLDKEGYSPRIVWRRVPVLCCFGEFAKSHGAATLEDLPRLVDAFLADWLSARRRKHWKQCVRNKAGMDVGSTVRQMLRQVLPGYAEKATRTIREPFAQEVPLFFNYLCDERGLSISSIKQYRYHLRPFEAYLHMIGVNGVGELSPPIYSAHMAERSTVLVKSGLIQLGCVLRVFAKYIHRERLSAYDLSGTIELPRSYSLSRLPRSITWDEVRKVLQSVDRRTLLGKRDYAILMLLVTYGLRAKEVAALTLDNIDWERERLLVPERKNGHSTAYPLSVQVGEALLEHLKSGRPTGVDRHLFFRALPPYRPLESGSVSLCALRYLRKAGIPVGRPGSHTLRHTCVQRLMDAGFPLKVVGDYVGHRSAESTKIYTKTTIEPLRNVAMTGEDII